MHPTAANADPLETAQTVMRNEVLDGNPPGSAPYEAARRLRRLRPEEETRPYWSVKDEGATAHVWFSLENGKWKQEKDFWEVVDRDTMVCYHNEPRSALLNPAKVRGAAMTRRLKHRHTFMVGEKGDVTMNRDNWFKLRRKTTCTPGSWTGFTIFSSRILEVENFLNGKPRGQGEIHEHEIKPHEWEGWHASDAAERRRIEGTNAIRVLSAAESREVRRTLQEQNQLDRILPSRMVRRWKPGEQPGSPDTRKSRWRIWGDRDPDLLDLQRYAPTLNSTSFGVLLQTAASMQYPASVGDCKSAFCQSLPLHRSAGKLYASQPKAGIKGLDPEQIVEIVAGCYGLGDAPAPWRKTLKAAVLELGYRESVIDPTIYYLHDKSKLQGAIAIKVDDLFTFGSSQHYEKIAQLRSRFEFSKFDFLQEMEQGTNFNGRRAQQNADFSFQVDMLKFVAERLDPVSLAKGRKATPKALASDSVVSQLRAAVGALSWLGKEGRPDASAAASLGSAVFPKPTVQDIIDVNKAVHLIKSYPDLSIKIRAIAVENLAWGVASDASFANAYGGHSQGAYYMGSSPSTRISNEVDVRRVR